MRYVIAYDVANDKRRKRIADALEAVLTRVQFSVFEGDVPEDILDKAVRTTLTHLEDTDSLRVYKLCAMCAKRIDAYGRSVDLGSDPVRIL